MPLIRKFAVQGHAVPQTASRPRGPFPPEVLAQPRVRDDYEYTENLYVSEEVAKVFRCKDCAELLYEDELDEHFCTKLP